MKSTPPPPPAFVRVSDRDLTEIELHSVDSISDLHRTHAEHHKGILPPRPPPPTTNGTLQMQDRIVVCQTGQPVRRPCMGRLNDTCTSSKRYILACAAIILLLLTLILIFVILVQQSAALQTLVEMLKHKHLNLTAMGNEQRP